MSKDNVEILLRNILSSNDLVVQDMSNLAFLLIQHSNLMMESLANQNFIIHLKEFELGLIDEDALLEHKNLFEEKKDMLYESDDNLSEKISNYHKD